MKAKVRYQLWIIHFGNVAGVPDSGVPRPNGGGKPEDPHWIYLGFKIIFKFKSQGLCLQGIQ